MRHYGLWPETGDDRRLQTDHDWNHKEANMPAAKKAAKKKAPAKKSAKKKTAKKRR